MIKLDAKTRRFFNKYFKFENAWLLEHDLDDVINNSWDKALQGDFLSKINFCTDEITIWGRQLRRQFRDQIKACRRDIDLIRQSHTVLMKVIDTKNSPTQLLKKIPIRGREQKITG